MADVQLFDALPAPIEDALRESIRRFGVLVPVVKDQHGRILDGHHRSRLADELGVDYRTDFVTVADDEEAREIARTLNSDRRHLDAEQRRKVVVALREAGHSYGAIGGALGVHPTTAGRDVASTAARAAVDAPQRALGSDGKSRPATRPPSEETVARVAEAVDLYKRGFGPTSIGKRMGVAQSTASGYLARAKAQGLLPEYVGQPRGPTEPRAPSLNGNGTPPSITAKTKTLRGNEAPQAVRKAIYALCGLVGAFEAFSAQDASPTSEEVARWEGDLSAAVAAVNRFRKQLKEYNHG